MRGARCPAFANALNRAGLRGWHLHALSLNTITYCLGLWIRAKTVDQAHRPAGERRALYVGLWPIMFWRLGDTRERPMRRGGPFAKR